MRGLLKFLVQMVHWISNSLRTNGLWWSSSPITAISWSNFGPVLVHFWSTEGVDLLDEMDKCLSDRY